VVRHLATRPSPAKIQSHAESQAGSDPLTHSIFYAQGYAHANDHDDSLSRRQISAFGHAFSHAHGKPEDNGLAEPEGHPRGNGEEYTRTSQAKERA